MVTHNGAVSILIGLIFALELVIFYMIMTGNYISPLCL